MNFPKIQIQTIDALIGMTTTKPIQRIEQPKAEQEIQQPIAKLSIKTTPSKLSIDAFEARESIGHKNVRARTAEMAQEGKQAALEGTARRAEEGQQLMRIENGGNPIREHAKKHHIKLYSSLNIKFIPQPGTVKINYEPAQAHIQFEPQKPVHNVKIHKPIHEYTPGKVNIEMLQYPSVKIDWLV